MQILEQALNKIKSNKSQRKFFMALIQGLKGLETDLELDTLQIYEFYVSRFQIEFIFRDAKVFTGLSDCQSRDKKRIDYHINAYGAPNVSDHFMTNLRYNFA